MGCSNLGFIGVLAIIDRVAAASYASVFPLITALLFALYQITDAQARRAREPVLQLCSSPRWLGLWQRA
jgi:hypothetical protein